MAGMVPEDIYKLISAGKPRVSPDGSAVVFVVGGVDAEKNDYRSRIWLTNTIGDEGDKARPFTSGGWKETTPRWSPDGKQIAFVEHPSEKGCDLVVGQAPDGDRFVICSFPEEIEELNWLPDGSAIVFAARDQDEHAYGPEKPRDQPPKRLTRMVNRLDNVGWTIDRPRHLFRVDVQAGSEPVLLTEGEFQVGGFSISPDGTELVFASARHDTWDTDLATDLFVMGAKGGEPEQLTKTGSSYSSPSWGPHGSLIAYRWTPNPLDGPHHQRIGVIDRSDGRGRLLTEGLDRNASAYPPPREPLWIESDIAFQVEDFGDLHLYRVAADAGSEPQLWLGDKGMQVVEFDHQGGTTAWTHSRPTYLPRLSVLTEELHAKAMSLIKESAGPAGATLPSEMSLFRTAGAKSVAGWGEELFDVELSTPIELRATSPDGGEVQGWVMRPTDLQIDQKYPAVLSIHGGPFTQYGNRFFDEFQVFAAAGYAVIYCNPRGSSGYSEAWGRAIRGPKMDPPGTGWGSVDYEDVMSVVDAAIEHFPFIDADRLGVIGGSYGGYMTSWIVGHTNRFKSAISERAVNNMYTQAYTCDIASYFVRELGPLYLDDPQEYLRISPITYVKNIETPVLILHSENDLRCPIEQAEQLFVALKVLGKQVEFVRFPGEGHELSRSGAPKHRVQRFEIVLEWFDRFLKDGAAAQTH